MFPKLYGGSLRMAHLCLSIHFCKLSMHGYLLYYSLNDSIAQVWKSVGKLHETFTQQAITIINCFLIMYYVLIAIYTGEYEISNCYTTHPIPQLEKPLVHLLCVLGLPLVYCVILNITMHIKNYKGRTFPTQTSHVMS